MVAPVLHLDERTAVVGRFQQFKAVPPALGKTAHSFENMAFFRKPLSHKVRNFTLAAAADQQRNPHLFGFFRAGALRPAAAHSKTRLRILPAETVNQLTAFTVSH